ncbi:MAG TPA: oligosaccharide flippase family protein [Gemmatimonadaceae bacterium]|nr:oligosaccharide flippase family protein [Gemmatimonadaceae bacterium]
MSEIVDQGLALDVIGPPPPLSEAALPPIRLQALGGYALMFAAATMVSKAVSFLMLPLYTRYLTPADYGVIELVELSLDIVSIIAGSRLLSGVFRFYHKANTEDERRSVMSTALVTICIGYATVGLLVFLAAPLVSTLALGDAKFTGIVRIAAVSLATQALVFVPPAFFRLRGQFRLVVATQLVRLALQVGCNIVLLTVLHMGAKSMFLGTLVANVLVGGYVSFLAWRQVGWRFSPRVAGDLYRYGSPLILTQVATFVLTFGDRYFLRAATDLSSVGRYTLAYQFAFLLATLGQTPFDLVWEPRRFEVARRPDRDRIYARVFIYLNVVLFTGAVGLSLFVHAALHLMTKPAFYGAADVVPVLLMAIILQSWAGSQDIGILVRERTHYVAIANWVAAGTILVAYALLVPRYAGWGAAIATVIGYAVRYGCTYAFAQRLWPVRYEWKPVLRIAALAVATVLIGYLIPAGPLAYSLMLRTLLLAGYIVLVWMLPILSTSDKHAARQALAALMGRAAAALTPDAGSDRAS